MLSKPSRLHFRPESDKVGKAVEVLALMMAEGKTAWIDADEAEETLDQIHASKGGSGDPSLYAGLVSEGVLAEDRFATGDGEGGWHYVVGARFAYERLHDYLVAKALLDQHLVGDGPQRALCRGRRSPVYLRGRITGCAATGGS